MQQVTIISENTEISPYSMKNVDYMYKSSLNAVSTTKSMDEPKSVHKNNPLNFAWEKVLLINMKIIFNLRNLNKFSVFTQSLIGCFRQFLHVSRSIWNLANFEIELHSPMLTDLSNHAS